jgi:hypothetical protein
VAGRDARGRGVDLGLLVHPRDVARLLWLDQRDDRAGHAGARRTAGAVQVVLVVGGRVEVDHQVDVVDVDAARRDVGRDEHPRRAGGEAVERALTRVLRQVAVDRGRLHAERSQLLGQPIGAVLGPDEEQRPARAGSDLGRDGDLLVGADREDVVVHRLDVRGVRGDRVHRRVGEVGLAELGDAAVEGRGEEHPLTAARGEVEQPGDGGQEAEVGHVVGLVEDGDLDRRERAGAALQVVEQPARRRDDDVDAAAELVDLPPHRRAAVDGGDLDADRLGERRERVGDLLGQLAGRHEDETARLTGDRSAVTGSEPGEHGQAEGERLARAGLRPAEHVAAGECVRDRPGLDGERRVDAAAGHRRDERTGEAERGERRRLGDGERLSGGERLLELVGGGVGDDRRPAGLTAGRRAVRTGVGRRRTGPAGGTGHRDTPSLFVGRETI